MDRFEFLHGDVLENEEHVFTEENVKIYDGDKKTHFEDGELKLSTHRIIYAHRGEVSAVAVTFCLPLYYVVSCSEETVSSYFFQRKTRYILHLRSPMPNKRPGPIASSYASFIKFSGKNGMSAEFGNVLRNLLEARIWEATIERAPTLGSPPADNSADVVRPRVLRSGIGFIERAIEAKAKETDQNIALAFKDLNVLMSMAKDMVGISKVISSKIREKKGDISEDETVRFKSYLLSLGIDDPVTRENFSSNTAYYKSLAQQICQMLLDPIEESGGMMSLADVYCRVNRARGLELISPEDLLHACQQLVGPIKLRKFPSGAMVLQLESQDDVLIAEGTLQKVEEAKSLACEELAKQLSISLLLAKERLLAAERLGKVCRDESVEGLRFYPNLILQRGALDE